MVKCVNLYQTRYLTLLHLGYAIILVLCEIARSQGKSARARSGLTEGEVPVGTSKEDKPLPAEIIWPGDRGAARKSSIVLA